MKILRAFTVFVMLFSVVGGDFLLGFEQLLSVSYAQTPFIAEDDVFVTTSNSFTGDLSLNDSYDGDVTYSLVSVDSGGGGVFVNENGTAGGTVAPGYVGTQTFTYSVCEGEAQVPSVAAISSSANIVPAGMFEDNAYFLFRYASHNTPDNVVSTYTIPESLSCISWVNRYGHYKDVEFSTDNRSTWSTWSNGSTDTCIPATDIRVLEGAGSPSGWIQTVQIYGEYEEGSYEHCVDMVVSADNTQYDSLEQCLRTGPIYDLSINTQNETDLSGILSSLFGDDGTINTCNEITTEIIVANEGDIVVQSFVLETLFSNEVILAGDDRTFAGDAYRYEFEGLLEPGETLTIPLSFSPAMFGDITVSTEISEDDGDDFDSTTSNMGVTVVEDDEKQIVYEVMDCSEDLCEDGSLVSTVGTSCDDGNPDTIQDRYVDPCNCLGQLFEVSITDPYMCGGNIEGVVTTPINVDIDRVEVHLDGLANSYLFVLSGTDIHTDGSYVLPIEYTDETSPNFVLPGEYTVDYAVYTTTGESASGSYVATITDDCEDGEETPEETDDESSDPQVTTSHGSGGGGGGGRYVDRGNFQLASGITNEDNEEDEEIDDTVVSVEDEHEEEVEEEVEEVIPLLPKPKPVEVEIEVVDIIPSEDQEMRELKKSLFPTTQDTYNNQGFGDFMIPDLLPKTGTSLVHAQESNCDVATVTIHYVDSLEEGEVEFINHPLPSQYAVLGQDDVVLFEFHVDVNEGALLEFDDVLLHLHSDYNGGSAGTCLPNTVDIAEGSSSNNGVFDALQLYHVDTGNVYPLAVTPSANGANCQVDLDAQDMDIILSSSAGSNVFQLIADVSTTLSLSEQSTIFGTEYYVEMYPTGGDVSVYDGTHNNNVTQVSPYFLSSAAVELTQSSIDIDILECGTNDDEVFGASDVELLSFEIETDEVSPVLVDEITITGNSNFTNAVVSTVHLYRGIYPNGTLVDSKNLFGSSSEVIFDGFGDVLIPVASTQGMYVTVDLLNLPGNEGMEISAIVSDVHATNDQGDSILYTIFPVTCIAKTVTIAGAGVLTIEEASNNNNLQDGVNVLGGETSDWVAAFDLSAMNENIIIEDIDLVASGANFATAINTLTVYGSDKSTILYGPTTVTSNTINLNNIDFIVPEANGGDTLYIKVEAEDIGANQSGVQSGPFTFTMQVNQNDAIGSDSGNPVDTTSTLVSGASDPFHVVPVDISNVQFINSSPNGAVKANPNGGLTTNTNVGILRITVDNSYNTNMSGGDLDMLIEEIVLDETLGAGTSVDNYRIYKAGGIENAGYNGIVSGGKISFDTSSSPDDFVLDANNGEVIDIVVVAEGVTLTSGVPDSVGVEIDDLSNGAITYSAYDMTIPGYASITNPRLGFNVVNNTAVSDND